MVNMIDNEQSPFFRVYLDCDAHKALIKTRYGKKDWKLLGTCHISPCSGAA